MVAVAAPIVVSARTLKGVLADNVVHMLDPYQNSEPLIDALLDEMELLTFDQELGKKDLVRLQAYADAIANAESTASNHVAYILQLLKEDVDNVLRAIERT